MKEWIIRKLGGFPKEELKKIEDEIHWLIPLCPHPEGKGEESALEGYIDGIQESIKETK